MEGAINQRVCQMMGDADLSFKRVGHSIQNYQLHWLIACLLLGLSSQASFSQCAPPPTTSGKILNYSFEPLLADGKMTLHVTLQTKTDFVFAAAFPKRQGWPLATHFL